MLRDISIENYRRFPKFQIEGLARVNLLVGPNNSGKTSFLEAIYLLINSANINDSFDRILGSRGEIILPELIDGEPTEPLYKVTPLFYRYAFEREAAICIQSKSDRFLSFSMQPNPTSEQIARLELHQFVLEKIWERNYNLLISHRNEEGEIYLATRVNQKGITPTDFSFLKQSGYNWKNIRSYFMPTSQLEFHILAEIWDEITLTPKEDKVVKALQILEPDVERISFTRGHTANSGILLKLRGREHPVSLGSMGEGMKRILNLAMAAVTVENGVLLVDEIDTGLYYDVQPDMWRLMLEIAQELNVQIFATTHSWDCVTAFSEALNESEDSSIGELFRLSWRGDLVRAIVYTKDELAKAVYYKIEVR